jgi:HSP90 family molecular chaperone
VAVKTQADRLSFGAEAVQFLGLMIHSLYSNREIFAGRLNNLLLALAG